MSAAPSICARIPSPSKRSTLTIMTWSVMSIGQKTTRGCSSWTRMRNLIQTKPDLPSAGYCLMCGTPLEARHHEDRDRPTCPACGFVHYLDPKVAVAVILGAERGVLLCRRCIDPGSGLWSFPAGYVNRGEVLEEAAAREVLEELGIVVR